MLMLACRISRPLYGIDQKRIIRFRWEGNPGDKVMDEAIDKLIEKAEGESRKD